MPASKLTVATAVAVLLPTIGCTGLNPAFDGERSEGGKTMDSADADDDGATLPTTPTTIDSDSDSGSDSDDDAVDGDATAASTDSGSTEAGSTGGQSTTADPACTVSDPVLFDVSAEDPLGNAIAPICGAIDSWEGPVSTGVAPHELVLAQCGGACDCRGGEPTTVHLSFTELVPSPADLLAGGEMGCFSISVARTSRADGCMIEWMSVESVAQNADFPSFFATTSSAPGWSLTVPPAELGAVLVPCESGCMPHESGEYEIFLDDNGPIAPGSSLPMELNPYASVGARYDVTALFAVVDESCVQHVGWSAIVTQ